MQINKCNQCHSASIFDDDEDGDKDDDDEYEYEYDDEIYEDHLSIGG